LFSVSFFLHGTAVDGYSDGQDIPCCYGTQRCDINHRSPPLDLIQL